MIGPCNKQTVTATIVTADGRRFVGTNYVRNHQPACPRGDMPTGVGYHLCQNICDQAGHAEIVALRRAKFAKLDGAVCYIEGHTYACEPCKAALACGGVTDIRFHEPPCESRP